MHACHAHRRWGASQFAPSAALANTIGGESEARYEKHGAHWRAALLSGAIERLAAHLGPGAERWHCLNVVVPSYRCVVRGRKEAAYYLARQHLRTQAPRRPARLK